MVNTRVFYGYKFFMLILVTFYFPIFNDISACSCGCGCTDGLEYESVFISESEELGGYLKIIDQGEKTGIYDEEYVKALYGAMNIYRVTDVKKGVELYKKARERDPYYPLCEDTEDGIIIRNVPVDERFRKLCSKNMINLGVCESIDDIEYLSDGFQVHFNALKKKVSLNHKWKNDDENWCKDNCDSLAFALGWPCSMLKNRWCTASCLSAVESMRRICKYCCEDGGFLQRCFWPLMDYLPRCDCDDLDW